MMDWKQKEHKEAEEILSEIKQLDARLALWTFCWRSKITNFITLTQTIGTRGLSRC